MLSRFALFLLLYSYLSAGLTETSKPDWNCAQRNKSEWGCSTLESITSEEKMMLADVQTNIEKSEPEKQFRSTKTSETFTVKASKNLRLTPIPVKPLKKQEQLSGWGCDPSSESDNWNCKLVGFNPRGQARLMEEQSHFLRFIPFAFDLEQEQNFEYMQSNFEQDPWSVCTLSQGSWEQYRYNKAQRTEVPVQVNADYS